MEEYLADGVIYLNVSRIGSKRVRSVEILKMRGVKHDESIHLIGSQTLELLLIFMNPSEVIKQIFSAAVLKKGAYK